MCVNVCVWNPLWFNLQQRFFKSASRNNGAAGVTMETASEAAGVCRLTGEPPHRSDHNISSLAVFAAKLLLRISPQPPPLLLLFYKTAAVRCLLAARLIVSSSSRLDSPVTHQSVCLNSAPTFTPMNINVKSSFLIVFSFVLFCFRTARLRVICLKASLR